MDEVQVKDLAKRYFPDSKQNEDACYLSIVEALGKQNLVPLYINIEIPPNDYSKRIFLDALDKINNGDGDEGAIKIEVHEWMGVCSSCYSVRMKVCPIAVGRFFELGKLFWKMYVHN
jgi:hypothetical protein